VSATVVPSVIGIVLALALGARLAGFERDRSFYATVLMVVASYYVLFGAMGASLAVTLAELAMASAFVLLAVLGARRSRWYWVAGLALHGLFDVMHPHIIANAGVPHWWPAFCLAYDLAAAAYLAVTLCRRSARTAHVLS
jgi:hypothetical protein